MNNGNGEAETLRINERPRRLRLNSKLRSLVRETVIRQSDFIYPLFIRHGTNEKRLITSMPGQYQLSIDNLADEIKEISDLGIPAVILFGIPESKDFCGSENFSPEGIIARAIEAIKTVKSDILVITDMCCCEYTSHGHCGIINTPDSEHFDPALPEGYLLNDATLELLAKASIVHAQAGADVIAPSGMIDGMVMAIRSALDSVNYTHIPIMSYAAKYSSAYYGPFRDAAESPPSFGNRSSYQMDPGNRREAIREVSLDVEQGADILMVKPALPYLDIISDIRNTYDMPVAAYQVSGEYSMIHAAAANGWLNLQACALESLTCIKRAGADMILTYFAKDAARWL